MTHGRDHILPNAELRYGFFSPTGATVLGLMFGFRDSVERLLQPPVTEREGLMARKLRVVGVLKKRSAHRPSLGYWILHPVARP